MPRKPQGTGDMPVSSKNGTSALLSLLWLVMAAVLMQAHPVQPSGYPVQLYQTVILVKIVHKTNTLHSVPNIEVG